MRSVVGLLLVGAAVLKAIQLVTDPWRTIVLDVAVVIGLLLSVWHCRGYREPMRNARMPAWFSQRALTTAILGVSGLSIALLVRYADSRTAVADGQLRTGGAFVILEPEKWVGRSLAIANSIDLDLSRGKWTVLLHRHDCPECQEAVSRYEELALQAMAQRIAFVEVPPYGEPTAHADGIHARLSDDREWFVQTPVEIQDGRWRRYEHIDRTPGTSLIRRVLSGG